MNKKQKKRALRILLSAGFFALALVPPLLLPLPAWSSPLLMLVPYLTVGWDVLWKAAGNIVRGRIFDENFLMALATVGAFAIGEYPEAVFVMLFSQVGELFESCAVDHSRKSIASLMDIRPDYANLEQDGQVREVDPQEVRVGEVIVIKPGERIPLDGVVLEGTSSVNTAALTGESLPQEVSADSDLISGCVNLTGLLRVQVTKAYEDSTVARILDLVENSSSKKARTESFITRFARVYTPSVVIAAVLLALLLPFLAGLPWEESIHRALIFLVISCPCALVISVPLSFFGGIGGASRQGILVKGGNYLEALSRSEIVVFDKTGTLTKGVFNVTAIHPDRCTGSQLLELAALAESYSDHPISRSLRNACNAPLDPSRLSDVEELSGRGVRVRIDGREISVGNDKLMEEVGVTWHPCHKVGTTVHVSCQGEYLGHIVISDEEKPDAAQAIAALKAVGVKKTVMLTGDAKAVGESVAERLGLDEVHTQLLPAHKVSRVEALLGEKSPNGALVFVGDGINDAPVLSRADVGIAMGALGSDAAIEAADVVLMDDSPSKIALAIRIARRTLSIVRQNIVFALAVKALVLLLGALGLASMWWAVFADVGVSVLAILNAIRALRAPS